MTPRPRHSNIVPFGGQLMRNPLRTNFSQVQVLIRYGVEHRLPVTRASQGIFWVIPQKFERHRPYSPPPQPSSVDAFYGLQLLCAAKNRITSRCSFLLARMFSSG
ncbi:hypothetical protein TNCV_1004311 [Trichonephila clavipes]|nr:hypothetical protein TNCV_1004311 [Trichonephila clavipes]